MSRARHSLSTGNPTPPWAIVMASALAGFLAAMLLSLIFREPLPSSELASRDVEWECTVSTGGFNLVVENSGDTRRSYAIMLEIYSQTEVLSSRGVHVNNVAPGERRVVAETLPVKTGESCSIWVW